jgi:hypothetical protein
VARAERTARNVISANDALILIEGKQQCGTAIVASRSRNNPSVAEELAKESFFDGTGGGNGCRQGQLLGSIGSV